MNIKKVNKLKKQEDDMEFVFNLLNSEIKTEESMNEESMNEESIIDRIPVETHIQAAFAQADSELKLRSKNRQFVLFLIIAFLLFGAMGLLILSGNENIIVYEQILLSVVMLVSSPFVIRRRLKKEGL